MKKTKVCICLVSVLFLFTVAISCQQSGAAGSVELRGAIHAESNGTGYYILSGGKRYHIDSQNDVSPMADKMVNIRGTVVEKDGNRTVVVESIKE